VGKASAQSQGSQSHHLRCPGHQRQYRAVARHLGQARQNGLTETELKEVIIHLAFYAGWPRAMSAICLARELFHGGDAQRAHARTRTRHGG
jgi:alkylhydroperoxidase/carboxymuconolactone decarboxylase family protein YurZ